MDQRYFEEMIQSITSVTDRGRTIPLKYTGVPKYGGSTLAFEFTCPDDGSRYFLKFSPNEDNGGGENRVLPKAVRLFKNETISEPDSLKRLGYIPVPTIITDDPSRFNPEFAKLFPRDDYVLCLQTAAEGAPAEHELPEGIADRLRILLSLAKLLRTCARNRIAYVDIKPLEHLFWVKKEGKLQITLIDWGISRAAADAALLAEDLRKYCRAVPEIVYGHKMADLSYKGKLTYPIQAEDRQGLMPFLSAFTFNGELAPLSQEYASLIGELLSGSANELRAQNRCVSVWDAVIAGLDRAILQLQGENADAHDTIANMDSRAKQILISSRNGSFADTLSARSASISSHAAWIAAAIRFTQSWYSRIDLLPRTEFDDAVRRVIAGDINGAKADFNLIREFVNAKIAQSGSFREVRDLIPGYLDLIGNVLEAWNYLDLYDRKKKTASEILNDLSASGLRVSDPILAELYKSLKNGGSLPASSGDALAEALKKTANESVKQPSSASVKPGASKEEAKGEEPKRQQTKAAQEDDESAGDPLIAGTLRSAHNLSLEAARTDNFMALRQTGFYQRLNEFCLNRNAFDNEKVREAFNPVLCRIAEKVELWGANLRPEKYFVSDDAVNSIDWLMNISPIVYTCSVDYEGEEHNLGTLIKSKLSEVFQSLYYALAKEQTAGEPPEIPAKIQQIKILRKRLDMENLAYLRSLIDRGEFEAANQIINLHYSESPYAFDQLNNEISAKRKEQADQKLITIVNAVLNDLSSNDTKLETTRYLNSQRSARMISDRFFNFKNRGTQLFDLQDELAKTKNALQDQKRAITSMKVFIIAALAAAAAALVIGILIFASSTARSAALTMQVSALSTANAEFRTENNAMLAAVAQTAAVQPEFPTPVPTEIPTPTPIPTEAPLIILEGNTEVSPANARLDSMLGNNVSFDLTGTTLLFADEELNENNQLGTVINYAQQINGKLAAYTDTAINIEAEFNIGRSQIEVANNRVVQNGSYIRLYSAVPSETTPIFILQKGIELVGSASACTDSQTQSFCHGTISIWFDRAAIESALH